MAKKVGKSSPAPGTKVVALHPIDQRHPVTFMRTMVFFVVRRILDQQLLRDSLDKLIRNHLPILGARLVPASKEGGLAEYHYPETFPQNATLFSWSTTAVDSTLDAAELLPDVSNSNGSIVWGRSVSDLETAWTPADWPRQRQDDKPDTPLLLVHITSYQDATVVSVNIPHAVADQKGLASMVESWLQVAQGLEPPPFLELAPGTLDGPADLPESELRKKGSYKWKTKGEHMRMILGIISEIVRDREETDRLMYLPASTVSRIRDKCNEELTAKYGLDHPILTNGDIVSSILSKLVYLTRINKKKTFALGETVNARGRHPALPEGAHYLHNCPAYACARFKHHQDTSLTEIALKHRKAIIETIHPSGIERTFAITKKVFEGGHVFPIGEGGDLSFHVTNWSSAWHGIDFSPVIQDKSAATNGINSATTHGKLPMLVLGCSILRTIKIHRMSAPVMCKCDGGYWVNFTCSSKNMALVDTLLKNDPLLEKF